MNEAAITASHREPETIARFLENPGMVDAMLNPGGRIWVDRLSEGFADTGKKLVGRWRAVRKTSPTCRPNADIAICFDLGGGTEPG